MEMPPSKQKRNSNHFLEKINYLGKFSLSMADVCNLLANVHQLKQNVPRMQQTRRYLTKQNKLQKKMHAWKFMMKPSHYT